MGLSLAGAICGPVAAQPRFDLASTALPPLVDVDAIAVGDLDNDGAPDLCLTAGGRLSLLRNEAGSRQGDGPPVGFWSPLPGAAPVWSDRTGRLRLAPAAATVGAGAFGDVDDDGDLDLLLTVDGAPTLWRNDRGDFRRAAGGDLDDGPGSGDGFSLDRRLDAAVWFDADRDGHLDLALHRAGGDLRVVHGDGDGRFEDRGPLPQVPPGSAGALAAADVDGDGWPDLLLDVDGGPGQLWRGGADGPSATTSPALAVVGGAADLLLGDLDGDGDLDLLRIAGLGTTASGAAVVGGATGLLRNPGDGRFATWRDAPPAGGGLLLDADADGDLDWVTTTPAGLLVNDGGGGLAPVAAGLSAGGGAPVVRVDVDGDDVDDLLFGGAGPPRLYRGVGPAGRSLRLVPVGDGSARDAVGTRVRLGRGPHTLVRQVQAPAAGRQSQAVVHFGLGEGADGPDTLETAWPSGRVDVATRLALGRTLYLYEGRKLYSTHEVGVSTWQIEGLADTLVAGRLVDLALTVTPYLEETKSGIDSVVADLSDLGGPASAPLAPAGVGVWALRVTIRADRPGRRQLRLAIAQSTVVGHRWIELSRTVAVRAPRTGSPPQAGAVTLLDHGLGPGWRAEVEGATLTVGASAALRLEAPAWHLDLRTDAAHDPVAYGTLTLALRLDDTDAARRGEAAVLRLVVDNRAVELLGPNAAVGLDATASGQQVVRLPLPWLQLGGALHSVGLAGNLAGTVWLDGVRLEAASPATAVTTPAGATLPAAPVLAPAYPNPANGTIAIPFSLGVSGRVRLTVHDILGGHVLTLVDELRPAGPQQASWDGRDAAGRPVASGVYWVRLTTAGQVRVGKVLRLR